MPKRSDRTATVIGVGKAGQGDSGAINQLLELLNRRGVHRVTLRSYSEYRSIVLSDRGSQYTVYTGEGVNTFDKGDVVVKCAKLPVGTEPLSDHDQRRVQASALYKEVAVLSHPRLRKHPNIVSLLWYDFVDLGNATFIPALVMEKATLGSLSALLEARNAGLDISARVDICSAITSGLLALHKADFAHGDVKPENVLMYGSAKAGVYVPKVADFGSAIVLEPESGSLGRYYGTPSRNAPEVGNQTAVKLDREGLLMCDNYSLGLLIAQVMIGEWNSDWEAKSPRVLPAIIQRYSAVRRGADIAIDAVAIFHRLLPVEPQTRCSDLSIVQQMFDPIGLEDISLAQ
jgi:serine/threonine protein kinase